MPIDKPNLAITAFDARGVFCACEKCCFWCWSKIVSSSFRVVIRSDPYGFCISTKFRAWKVFVFRYARIFCIYAASVLPYAWSVPSKREGFYQGYDTQSFLFQEKDFYADDRGSEYHLVFFWHFISVSWFPDSSSVDEVMMFLEFDEEWSRAVHTLRHE